MAVEGNLWALTFGELITDAVFSPDGKRVACIGKDKGKYTVAVDGTAWNGDYDMVWPPVFGPDSRHVAAKAEKNGTYHILVDGKPSKESYRALWNPTFGPDGDKLMIRGIEAASETGFYCRRVLSVTDI